MAGAVIRNVQGTAHLGAQAQDIIALIDRFGDQDAAALRVAAQQLEDPDAPPAVRSAAQVRLKSFLRQLAGKAEDIALSMLEKYIESKIGA